MTRPFAITNVPGFCLRDTGQGTMLIEEEVWENKEIDIHITRKLIASFFMTSD